MHLEFFKNIKFKWEMGDLWYCSHAFVYIKIEIIVELRVSLTQVNFPMLAYIWLVYLVLSVSVFHSIFSHVFYQPSIGCIGYWY